ncbi:MAG TPA: type II and III secretion system family protein, partial [Rhodospirillaceae bacterium]|nr:type II and III secretion system family protein [Rhodospirillaceae bacterium]
LGSDVLVPEMSSGDPLPDEIVGPFELRSENLAGALQLILADYEIPLAFETNEGMTRTVTVANL